MNILYETGTLRLEHDYETVRLTEKLTGEALLEDSFYGDPKCGLIGSNNDWAIAAGEHITIWTPAKSQVIKHEELKWIHDMRVKDDRTVELLTDPWSEISSIWIIDVGTFAFEKDRAFVDYKGREYSDDVFW